MSSDKQQVLDMVNKYTQTVNQGDARPELIDQLWEQSPDASNINPRGHHKGFKDIKDNFYPPLFALLTDRNLRVVGEPAVYVFDNTAVVEFYWKLDAKLKDGGGPVKMEGRETHVLRRKGGQWKLIHLHYSGMPVQGF